MKNIRRVLKLWTAWILEELKEFEHDIQNEKQAAVYRLWAHEKATDPRFILPQHEVDALNKQIAEQTDQLADLVRARIQLGDMIKDTGLTGMDLVFIEILRAVRTFNLDPTHLISEEVLNNGLPMAGNETSQSTDAS